MKQTLSLSEFSCLSEYTHFTLLQCKNNCNFTLTLLAAELLLALVCKLAIAFHCLNMFCVVVLVQRMATTISGRNIFNIYRRINVDLKLF